MPKMNGIDLLASLRRRRVDLPAILSHPQVSWEVCNHRGGTNPGRPER
jgi:hypothetical protein